MSELRQVDVGVTGRLRERWQAYQVTAVEPDLDIIAALAELTGYPTPENPEGRLRLKLRGHEWADHSDEILVVGSTDPDSISTSFNNTNQHLEVDLPVDARPSEQLLRDRLLWAMLRSQENQQRQDNLGLGRRVRNLGIVTTALSLVEITTTAALHAPEATPVVGAVIGGLGALASVVSIPAAHARTNYWAHTEHRRLVDEAPMEAPIRLTFRANT